MRLTLRTLLAYLDDTLPPAEIKEIGQKVAESDAAQELVARLKAVTRRRRLTAPPTSGPNSLDANRVAEYLDNELAAEELAELEKLALESDVHLAEIAACHQILTLVLGEPALVPPTAQERMYRLVQGREALPYRKAAPVKKAADALDEDETLSLSGGWLKWMLPVAGLLLVVMLGLAIYQVIPPTTRTDNRSARTNNTTNGKSEPDQGAADQDKNKNKGKDKDKTGSTEVVKDNSKKAPPVDPDKDKGPKDKGKVSEDDDKEKDVERPAQPSADRVEAGKYKGSFAKDLPSVLVRKQTGKDGWQRVAANATIHTADTLTVLPGYNAVLRTPKDTAQLTLRSHVPDFSLYEIQFKTLETTIVLHKNDKFDLDLTLLRGRVYIRNTKAKGPFKVRLRFEGEVWDLTLGDRGEVGVDLFKFWPIGIDWARDEEPAAQLGLCLFNGELELKVDPYTTVNWEVEAPKVKVMFWNSETNKATAGKLLDAEPPIWDKRPPAGTAIPEALRTNIKQMLAAMQNLAVLLAPTKSVSVALQEMLTREEIPARMLAVYCLGAIDDVSKLSDVLDDENDDHWIDRQAAIFTLRHWISRGVAAGKVLYNEKKDQPTTGVLVEKFKKAAKTVYQLLHDFPPSSWRAVETFQALARGLQHRRTAVAELAFYHLKQLSIGAKLPPGFNAAAPLEDREAYAMLVDDMIAKKKLPPPPPERPGKPAEKPKDKGKE